MKNKYSARVLKEHRIVIHMTSMQVNGQEIPGTEYDTYLDRKLGLYGFKTLRDAKAFVERGNRECAGAYELVRP